MAPLKGKFLFYQRISGDCRRYASGKITCGMEMCRMIRLNNNGAPSLEAQMLYRQALELIGLGKNDAALIVLEKAVMVAPRFTRALIEMGNCLDRLGRYPEAVAACNKVLAIDPLYEGALIKRDVISKKIESSFTGRQHFAEKAHETTRREGRDPDHSLINDLAAIARIQYQGTISLPCTRCSV
jgi:tetratricopeptide (TPR) repeat protein